MRNPAFDHKKIALIGVPSSAGARSVGQDQAPKRLRELGIREQLRDAGLNVLDMGDLAPVVFRADIANPTRQNLPLILEVNGAVAKAVDAALAERAWPLVIGGDCTITIGVLASLTRHFPSLGMIYLDGDLDMNTPETSPSGIFDGMGLAHIIGRGDETLSRSGSRYPLLEDSVLTLFGYSVEAGGIDPAELDALSRTRAGKYPRAEIVQEIGAAARRALRGLEQTVEHFLVHFDIDVVDAAYLPAVDFPHSPGLTLRQTEIALEVFLQSPQSVGMVITEYNAALDPDGAVGWRLVSALGDVMARVAALSTDRS